MNNDFLYNLQYIFTKSIPFVFNSQYYSNKSIFEFLLVSIWIFFTAFILKKVRKSSNSWSFLLTLLILFLLNSLCVATCMTCFNYFPFWLYLVTTICLWLILLNLISKLLDYIIPPHQISKYEKKVVSFLLGLLFFLWATGLGREIIRFSQGATIQIGKFSTNILTLILGIFCSIIAFIISLWAGRFIESRIMQFNNIDENFKIVIAKISKFLIVFMVITIILPILGIDITALTILGGSFAAGLGFSLKNIVSNYISGFVILLDQSVRLHDKITINNFTGYVTDISTRFVTLKSNDGAKVLIPNEKIISDIVKNEGILAKQMLQEFSLQLDHQNDIKQSIAIVKNIITQNPNVNNHDNITVIVSKITPAGIELKASYWINHLHCSETNSQILQQIYHEFNSTIQVSQLL